MKPRTATSSHSSRRSLLGILTASGLILGGCAKNQATVAVAPPPRSLPLVETDQIDINGEPAAVAQKAYELGHRYEGESGGCAQCTVAALQDALDFVPADPNVFLAASTVDGGATPNGLGTCGAYTGAGMIIGQVCGRSRENFLGKKDLSRALLRRVHAKFDEAYGGVICKQVRGKSNADCLEVVGRSAQWTAEILIEQFGKKA